MTRGGVRRITREEIKRVLENASRERAALRR